MSLEVRNKMRNKGRIVIVVYTVLGLCQCSYGVCILAISSFQKLYISRETKFHGYIKVMCL